MLVTPLADDPIEIRWVETVLDSRVVEAELAGNVDGVVKVSISDNGVGIPADRMVHVFEPFQSTKARGQGLGLFACKHIVEMHWGSVAVQSMEGAWTCVT